MLVIYFFARRLSNERFWFCKRLPSPLLCIERRHDGRRHPVVDHRPVLHALRRPRELRPQRDHAGQPDRALPVSLRGDGRARPPAAGGASAAA